MRSGAERPDAGGALLEMIVVLVVVAMCSALVFPFFNRNPPETQMLRVVQQLALDLNRVRSSAVRTGGSQGAAIDLESLIYRDASVVRNLRTSPQTAIAVSAPTLDQGSRQVDIRFAADGSSRDLLLNFRERSKSVDFTVDGWTGLSRIVVLP